MVKIVVKNNYLTLMGKRSEIGLRMELESLDRKSLFKFRDIS